MSGVVVWFTGLPSSGKSRLAVRTHVALSQAGRPVCLLDGDEVRKAIVPAPGYGPWARDAFYATLARLAAMLAKQGMTVLVAATAHRRVYRDEARAVAPRFVEVFVDVPVDECVRRDAKGVYAAARAGRLRGVPGADVPYEAPDRAEVVARGGDDEGAVAQIVTRAAAA